MIPVTLPEEEKFTLTVHRTDRFKSGLLSFSVCRPIERRETMLASLLIPVLFRGCAKYPDVQKLNSRLDYLFGTELYPVNYYRGNAQVWGMTFDVLEQKLLPAGAEDLVRESVALMREILFHPLLDADGLFTENYVESEKKLRIEGIRARRNYPGSYARGQALDLVFRGEPRSVPLVGTEEEIAAVTREELTAFWKRFIAEYRPLVFYVGSLDAETLKKIVSEEMRECPIPLAWERTPVLPAAASLYHDRPLLREEESLPIGQGRLCIGFRCGTRIADRDYYACKVFNEIFGGLPTSRLFLHVREKMGLCYSCSSSYLSFNGIVLVDCGLQNENRGRAEREIFRQLELLASGDVTDEELNAAKAALISATRQVWDSPSSVKSFYFCREIAGISCTEEEYSRAVAAVTREDVTRVAGELAADAIFFLRADGTGREEESDGADS